MPSTAAGAPIAQLDFSDADTLPGFPLDDEEQVCAPHDVVSGAAGWTMVSDDGTHPDARIPFTTGMSAAEIFRDLATVELDAIGVVS